MIFLLVHLRIHYVNISTYCRNQLFLLVQFLLEVPFGPFSSFWQMHSVNMVVFIPIIIIIFKIVLPYMDFWALSGGKRNFDPYFLSKEKGSDARREYGMDE